MKCVSFHVTDGNLPCFTVSTYIYYCKCTTEEHGCQRNMPQLYRNRKNKAFSCVYLIKNYVKKLSKCWKIDSYSLYILEKQGIFSLDSVKSNFCIKRLQ